MGRVFEPGGCSPSCDAELVEVLPTLAWAPEGWGCEGANEAPSRTSASASGDEVRGGQVHAPKAGEG